MALNSQAQVVLDILRERGGVPVSEMSPAQARANDWFWVTQQGPVEAVASVVDTYIPGPTAELHVRVYTPDDPGPLPCLVVFHGGGWTVGNLAITDRPNRSIANALGCVVVAVNYQTAPEHPFPTALDDCYAALIWTVENAAELGVDPSRIGVGGDSAGGNLAAAACLKAKQEDWVKVAFQLLIYPALDPAMDYPSARENAEGFGLTTAAMRWFWDNYVPDPANRVDPLAAPVHADDLAGLPPAIVVTVGNDPLRDEGERYADQLAAAGVEVVRHRYDDTIHGFLWMAGALTVDFQTLMDDLAADLNRLTPAEDSPTRSAVPVPVPVPVPVAGSGVSTSAESLGE